MGRPVNKKYFGVTQGSTGIEGNNFTVNAKLPSVAVSQVAIILRQRSSVKFKIDTARDGSGSEGICTLVDKAPAALSDNEMSIPGFNGAGQVVFIKRLYNRTAHGFNGKRYKWTIVDDSSSNYMQLTEI